MRRLLSSSSFTDAEDLLAIETTGKLPFEVRVDWRDDVVTLEFLGELDLWGHEEAVAALTEAISGCPRLIVVDLQRLTFMGSTGLRCLLEAKLLADVSRARMVLVNGSGAPHRLLELTGMDGVFEMVDDPAKLAPPVIGPR